MIYNSILETIGNTPIVKVNNVGPDNQNIYVKCESFNPLSSVKDRLAIAIIEDAEKNGLIKPGQTVIEATSGNTGIALAMVCAAKGYPFVATMVETFSIERRRIMKALGAKVILTPAAERGTGMVKRAEELAKEHGWFLARQFENQANPGRLYRRCVWLQTFLHHPRSGLSGQRNIFPATIQSELRHYTLCHQISLPPLQQQVPATVLESA